VYLLMIEGKKGRPDRRIHCNREDSVLRGDYWKGRETMRVRVRVRGMRVWLVTMTDVAPVMGDEEGL